MTFGGGDNDHERVFYFKIEELSIVLRWRCSNKRALKSRAKKYQTIK
jgi:hypothetical protein